VPEGFLFCGKAVISEPPITALLLTESSFSAKKENPLAPRVQKSPLPSGVKLYLKQLLC